MDVTLITKDELQKKITSRNLRKKEVLALLKEEGWRVRTKSDRRIILDQHGLAARITIGCKRRMVSFDLRKVGRSEVAFYANELQLLGELADLHLTPIGVSDED